MTPNPIPHRAPNCSFVLDNGQPCRAPARRADRFCRHHSPEALARRRRISETGTADPVPANGSARSEPEISPWALRGYWRMHHRLIPAYNSGELDDTFDMILVALADRQIAPRSAGRLILAILDRRRALAREAQEDVFRALCDRAIRQQARSATAHPVSTSTTPLEDLNKYFVSVAHPGKSAQIRI